MLPLNFLVEATYYLLRLIGNCGLYSANWTNFILTEHERKYEVLQNTKQHQQQQQQQQQLLLLLLLFLFLLYRNKSVEPELYDLW